MDLGSLVGIIIVLTLIGVVLYLLLNYVPIIEPIRTLILVVVVLSVVLYILSFIGIVPRFR